MARTPATQVALTGRSLIYRDQESHCVIRNYSREMGYEKLGRHATDTLDVKKRIVSLHAVVEKGFTPGQARREASRCLTCNVNTIFDGNRCILCGGCQDVCPMVCLKLLPLNRLDGTQDEFGGFVDRVKDVKGTETLTAIIKDEERCIRCGLCALRCPVSAISMEEFSFQEKLA